MADDEQNSVVNVAETGGEDQGAGEEAGNRAGTGAALTDAS